MTRTDKMHAGLLDKVIHIEKRTQDQAASGQPLNTWVRVATLYAKVTPAVGSEYAAASQITNEVAPDITVRYQRYIKPQMRVLYLDKVYEIEAVIDPEERREWLYLKCKGAVLV